MVFDLSQKTEQDILKIEHVLAEHPAIKDVAVVKHQDHHSFIAYIVPATTYAKSSQFWQLMHLEQSGELMPLRYCLLPNGLLIAHEDPFATIILYTEVFWSKIHFRHGISLNEDAYVIDVGANIGLFTLLAHQQCKNIHMLAFEPGPSTVEVLRTNGMLHQVDLKVFPYGLAETTKTAPFVFFPNISGISGFYWKTSEAIGDDVYAAIKHDIPEDPEGKFKQSIFEHEVQTCQLRPLSSVLQEEHIECVDLLKIDAEKSELAILQGIQEEDWKKIKQLVIEVHNYSLLEPIVEILEHQAYDIVVELPENQPEDEDTFKDDQYIVFAEQSQGGPQQAGEVKYIPIKVSSSTPTVRTGANSLFTSHASAVNSGENSSSSEMLMYIRPDELLDFLQGETQEAVPLALEFVLLKSLPRNADGKVDRHLLSLIELTR